MNEDFSKRHLESLRAPWWVGYFQEEHIVPRWVGGSNFIAVIGGTRIIPDGLLRLYERFVKIQSELP